MFNVGGVIRNVDMDRDEFRGDFSDWTNFILWTDKFLADAS